MQALAFPSAAQALDYPSLNETSLVWVFFNTCGGTPVPATQLVTPGGKVTRPADPSRSGYTFGGWYADSTLTTAWDFNRLVSSIVLTLYAKWNVIIYPVTYMLDGGAQNPANPTSYTIETPDITLAVPARAGFTFGGWFTNSQFEDSLITVIPQGLIGAVFLYAKWNLVTYRITYDLNGGENSSDNPDTYTVIDSTIILLDPVRLGYTFLGWYDDRPVYPQAGKALVAREFPSSSCAGYYEHLGNRVYQIPAGSTGDIALLADFSMDTYIIEYVLNGGENDLANKNAYTVYDTVPLYAPSRHGYAFAGWFEDAGFTDGPISMIKAGTTGNLKFFARWATAFSFPTGREHIDRYSGDPKFF
jgi:uncharacterized repeat protein (TIGR02543 family)